MSEIDYVIRKDNEPASYGNVFEFCDVDTEEILKNYPYILDSINNGEYYIENPLCGEFFEIVFENKVVGFSTYELKGDIILLTEFYVLPEFRGCDLFCEELNRNLFTYKKFGILQPTRDIIESLQKAGFAKKFNEDFVVSGVNFYFDIDFKSNKNHNFFIEEIEESNFYDLSINSTIFVVKDIVFYHDTLENDLNRYGNRRDLSDDYFKSIIDFFSENFDELYDMVFELEDDLPISRAGFEDIVGYGDGLSEFMLGLVDDNFLTYDEALEIKNKLKKEYESGEIVESEVQDRFSELYSSERNVKIMEHDDNELLNFAEFVYLFGDNDNLREGVFNSIINQDFESFHNLITTEMKNNEEFRENFIELSDKVIDDINQKSDLEYDDDIRLLIFKTLKNIEEKHNLRTSIIMASIDYDVDFLAFKNLLIRDAYVDETLNYTNYDKSTFDSLSDSDLKDILKTNNLSVSGKRQDLIDRIKRNNLLIYNFTTNNVTITQKGYDFLEEYKWIEFYDKFLNYFDFNEFKSYFESHEGDIVEISIGFLDTKIDEAEQSNDIDKLNMATASKSFIQDIIKINPDDEMFNIK